MVDVEGHRRRRWPLLVVVIVLIAVAIGTDPRLVRSGLGTSPWPFDPHTVGTACSDDHAWTCASIEVPLDRTAAASDTITIRFRILARRLINKASVGTVVVVNGGPGDPSMPQHAWAQKAFASLLADHDLLLVDNRGSGASGRIDCPKADETFAVGAVAQCRTILGSRAGDYGTIAAVDDLDAVLERVHANNVDLYGESYGTFFAQVFALRHPQHLQRMVLDGALPLDEDPWRVDALPEGLTELRSLCVSNSTCRASGDPLDLIAKALSRLRSSPRTVRGATLMAELVANAGRGGSAYRELPAALGAYLRGDRTALFRLLNEASEGGFGDDLAAESTNSNGLLLADLCADYPQPFDLRAPLAEQHRQLQARYDATATSIARVVSPFTPREAMRVVSTCIGWPAPTGETPQTIGRHFADVPTLVLEGGLDTVTPPRGARSVAAEFRQSHYVEVPFVGHIAALNERSGCASSVAATFLMSGTVDTACLSHLVAPPQVDAFPLRYANETPIRPITGSTKASVDERRTLAIARDTVADVMWRWARLHLRTGRGLRGGTFESTRPLPHEPGDLQVHLDGIQWTTDTSVSGYITTDSVTPALTANLYVTTPSGSLVIAVYSSNPLGPSAVETISGVFDGSYVSIDVDAKLGL